MNKEFEKIYSEAKKDPSLLSKIDANELLEKMSEKRNSYLDNKTNRDIMEEIKKTLEDEYGNELSKKELLALVKRLVGYRVVDELDSLHISQQTRWIQKYQDKVKLTNGGLLLNTLFTDEGINLVIKLWSGNIIQVRFDDCLVFQKLGYEEQIILMASDYANS